MRLCVLALFASFVCSPFAIGEDQIKPIPLEEAVKKVNEQVTLQMEVKSGALRDGHCFLNSEEDFKDAKNFTVFVNKEVLAKFKEAKIDDPAAHFKGKAVQVTGKVTLYRDRPQIILSSPDAIKIAEKK